MSVRVCVSGPLDGLRVKIGRRWWYNGHPSTFYIAVDGVQHGYEWDSRVRAWVYKGRFGKPPFPLPNPGINIPSFPADSYVHASAIGSTS